MRRSSICFTAGPAVYPRVIGHSKLNVVLTIVSSISTRFSCVYYGEHSGLQEPCNGSGTKKKSTMEWNLFFSHSSGTTALKRISTRVFRVYYGQHSGLQEPCNRSGTKHKFTMEWNLFFSHSSGTTALKRISTRVFHVYYGQHSGLQALVTGVVQNKHLQLEHFFFSQE